MSRKEKYPTTDLQWLANMIDSATDGGAVKILREWIGKYIMDEDKSPPQHVIRMAECMLRCGVNIELEKRN